MLVQSGQAEKVLKLEGVYIEKRSIGGGEFGLFIIGVESKISKKFGEKLQELCIQEDCLFIQIEILSYDSKDKVVKGFKNGAYKKFITPYTAVIDVRKSEEDILKAMKAKGRYNIRLAEKKGIEIKVATKNEYNIQAFYDLVIETTSRDGFSGNTLQYYSHFLHHIDKSKLLLAYYEGKIIAGGIFIFDTDASIYYYGASTSNPDYRNLMAPYLLQWKAISIAKSVGSKLYDFLGVASPGDKNSELAGVTSFKMKLSPDIREVSRSYIWINKRFKYTVLNLVRRLKRFIK